MDYEDNRTIVTLTGHLFCVSVTLTLKKSAVVLSMQKSGELNWNSPSSVSPSRVRAVTDILGGPLLSSIRSFVYGGGGSVGKSQDCFAGPRSLNSRG